MTVAPPPRALPDPRPSDEQHEHVRLDLHVSSLSMADLEVRARDLPAARVHFEAHLRTHPQDAGAWLSWARAEERLDERLGAERVLSRGAAVNVDDDRLWLAWAKAAMDSGGPKAATAVHRAAALACPGSAQLALARAMLDADACGIVSARDAFERCVALDPTIAKSYLTWATREERAGNVGAARRILADAVKCVPRKRVAVIYTMYASLEARQRKPGRARFLYMRAAEANPRDKVVWQAWACLEAKLGNNARARELFEHAVVVDPHYANTWQAWGMLEAKLGNVPKARTLLERGIRADPSEPATWHAWGTLEHKAGERARAATIFAEGVASVGMRRRAAPLYLSWAALEANARNYSAARRLYAEALARPAERKNDRAKLLHAWARVERENNKADAARALYARALNETPNDVITIHSLATLEENEGHYDDARRLLNRGRKVSPHDVKCILSLAALEWTRFADQGGVQRARQLFEGAHSHCRQDKSFLRAWAAFEEKHGDTNLAARLRSHAHTARRR